MVAKTKEVIPYERRRAGKNSNLHEDQFRRVDQKGRNNVVIITQNGKAKVVLQNLESYQRQKQALFTN